MNRPSTPVSACYGGNEVCEPNRICRRLLLPLVGSPDVGGVLVVKLSVGLVCKITTLTKIGSYGGSPNLDPGMELAWGPEHR